MKVGATLSIEFDECFNSDTVHVDDEAITAGIIIHDVHCKTLQRRPVESGDQILLEILLCSGDVTSASIRIVSVPQECREVEQSTIRKCVMNQRGESIVFVSRPSVGSVGALAFTLRIAKTQCLPEPIVVPGAPVELEQALNDSFLRPRGV